ncbi:hypothetical protein ACFU6S_18735, partial [Streptomyces sp. NPDC057456]
EHPRARQITRRARAGNANPGQVYPPGISTSDPPREEPSMSCPPPGFCPEQPLQPSAVQPAVFWPPAAPKVGQRVLYRLSDEDVRALAADGRSAGRAGDRLPADVTRVDGDTPAAPCNLMVITDGHGSLWVRHALGGTGPGTWSPWS